MAMIAGADPLAELAEREELAEVAAHAQVPDAFDVEDHEADQGHADGDVHVARRRAKLRDLADGRDEADPVVEQDQQEERGEDRDVRTRRGAGDARRRSR